MKLRDTYTCPLELVHDMIRGKWKPIVLWRLRLGKTTLAQLERDIDGITQKITRTSMEENASQTATDFVQGLNSWVSLQGGRQSPQLSARYGGMAPPNEPHTYELHVYALDTLLDLKDGFWFHEMFRQMEGHILAQATVKGVYRN